VGTEPEDKHDRYQEVEVSRRGGCRRNAEQAAEAGAGSAEVNPHQLQFCRSLSNEVNIIKNTKIRLYLHVYSDSKNSKITNLKHLGCLEGYKVTCKFFFRV
jgi:hypothetical protein